MHELKLLGDESLTGLVQFYSLVEATAKWPTAMQEVPVAALRKPTGTSPLDIRPISLAPIIYRIWAKIRFKQLQTWHVLWLPDVLRGGAPNREAADVYYHLALDIEHAQSSNHPLFGIFWDYKKCFDQVAWTIEYGLLHRMGMPPRVLEAMFSYTRAIQRRFKLGTSIGPLFPNTNGIMQGCPLAILRINCIMMAWARTIQHNAHTSLCTIGVYMDDKNARASSLQQLQDVVKLTEPFDDHVDAVVNLRRTVAYATTTTSRRSLSSVTINNQPVPTLADDRLLGAQASFTKRRSRALADKRAADYLTVAERVVICPLNIAAKETILTTAGGTKYSFGLEMGGCSKKLETSLRSTVVQALWRGRARKAVDIILTICHKGHRFDPVQLRVIWPLLCARKQLLTPLASYTNSASKSARWSF